MQGTGLRVLWVLAVAAAGCRPPPCRINVSGDASITPTAIEGTYRGANDCVEEPVREGRLSLVRP
ncbi:MAG TPA: hypothetical protein VFO85_08275 [Vicinamibacteria bacterium]|nr:hypothetical protein [Vicinamibacteria bacterium]